LHQTRCVSALTAALGGLDVTLRRRQRRDGPGDITPRLFSPETADPGGRHGLLDVVAPAVDVEAYEDEAALGAELGTSIPALVPRYRTVPRSLLDCQRTS